MAKKPLIRDRNLDELKRDSIKVALAPSEENEHFTELPLTMLESAPWNARRWFDEGELVRLAENMQLVGQIEPVVVRKHPERQDMYQVVAGERRLRAAKIANLTKLKVEVRQLSEFEARRLSLSENLERSDLSLYEETMGFFDLILLDLRERNPELYEVQGVLQQFRESDSEDLQVVLRRALHHYRSRYKRKSFEADAFSRYLESLFSRAGRVSWTSFLQHRLPVLDLPEELTQQLKRGTIEMGHAVQLAQVNGAYRETLLALAQAQRVSLQALRVLIKAESAAQQKRLLEIVEEDGPVDVRKLESALRVLKEGSVRDRKFMRQTRTARRLLSEKNLKMLEPEKRQRLLELLRPIEELLAQ